MPPRQWAINESLFRQRHEYRRLCQARTAKRLAASDRHGELRLHFQPKVNVASGRMTGAEALVRWQHPQRGLLGPGQFIPLAEELGLIAALGDWVVAAAARHLRQWADRCLEPVCLSVNLAAPASPWIISPGSSAPS